MHKTVLPQSGCKGQLSALRIAEHRGIPLNRCASGPACRPLQQLRHDMQGILSILAEESLASLQALLSALQAIAAAMLRHTPATVAGGSPVQAAGNTRGTCRLHRVTLGG